MNLFWTHVVGSSNVCVRQTLAVFYITLYNPRETEVTKFHIVIDIKEDVAWFQVAMQYFTSFDASIMTLSQSQ